MEKILSMETNCVTNAVENNEKDEFNQDSNSVFRPSRDIPISSFDHECVFQHLYEKDMAMVVVDSMANNCEDVDKEKFVNDVSETSTSGACTSEPILEQSGSKAKKYEYEEKFNFPSHFISKIVFDRLTDELMNIKAENVFLKNYIKDLLICNAKREIQFKYSTSCHKEFEDDSDYQMNVGQFCTQSEEMGSSDVYLAECTLKSQNFEQSHGENKKKTVEEKLPKMKSSVKKLQRKADSVEEMWYEAKKKNEELIQEIYDAKEREERTKKILREERRRFDRDMKAMKQKIEYYKKMALDPLDCVQH